MPHCSVVPRVEVARVAGGGGWSVMLGQALRRVGAGVRPAVHSVTTAQGGLEGVAETNAHLPPCHDPPRRCMPLGDLEAACVVVEEGSNVRQQPRERALQGLPAAGAVLVLGLLHGAAINENVPPPGVPMEVGVHLHIAPLDELDSLQVVLQVPDFRVQAPVRPCPLAVQVPTGEGASVVAVHHSVRVQHGDDLPDEVVPEVPGGLVVVVNKEVDEPLDHPRGDCLPGMHPARDDTHLALCNWDGALVVEGGDGEEVADVVVEGAAECLVDEVVRQVRVRLGQVAEVVLQVGVRVGVRVRQVRPVERVLELDGEVQCEVGGGVPLGPAAHAPGVGVAHVEDVVPGAGPSHPVRGELLL
mmetsp:Transcript_145467/g.253887  ORF Transcript_145467/g.253887 Transcript_145467/m.253887 type:complete len:358 (-) Transcript_145467:1822-2895(-)